MNETGIARWEKIIGDPIWYRHIVPDFQDIATLHRNDNDAYERAKESAYDFFERHLLRGTVALGNRGKDWDAERKPIDTIVIHHTSNPPGLRLSRLSAIELIRLYAPQYAKPRYEADRDIIGQPIYSGHVRDGAQVFWPYQWLVRSDGSAERLLYDEEIGWQAGNWDVNCRSVAICLDGDFENSTPSHMELATVAQLIREQYPSVKKENVLGHCEINLKTTCPSTKFLTYGNRTGWKKVLLDLV